MDGECWRDFVTALNIDESNCHRNLAFSLTVDGLQITKLSKRPVYPISGHFLNLHPSKRLQELFLYGVMATKTTDALVERSFDWYLEIIGRELRSLFKRVTVVSCFIHFDTGCKCIDEAGEEHTVKVYLLFVVADLRAVHLCTGMKQSPGRKVCWWCEQQGTWCGVKDRGCMYYLHHERYVFVL
jgi:hypothetical protein